MTPRRADVLVGWKEIAAYLGCSVATAARRERDGLPVFRSGGQIRAFPGDLDKWLKALRADELNSPTAAESVEEVEVTKDISAILATLLKGDSQERFAVIRLGKDVAEFEHIEVQLKSAEEKYRELVEAIPEWVWEMNAEGEYVYSSPQVADILGYEPEDVKGFKPSEFLIHPDDAGECGPALEALTGQKEIVHGLLCRFIHREGSVRYIETSANPVFDVSGNISGVRGVSRDVTEKVRLQTEIAETRRYLENVLRGSMDAIITTDMDGRVKVWNRGAEATYGYSENEALGKSVDRLTDPPGWSRKFKDLFGIIEARGGWYAEEPVERRRKDGTTFYASASYSIVYGADGKPVGVCGITRDITDRLNAERFTREALSRFESVLENVPNVAVQGFGRDGTVQHWNRAAERIFGCPAEETVGADVGRLPSLPAKERGGFTKELERIFATGEPNEPNEFSFDGREGERRWVYSQMFPVMVDGKVDEVFRISVDVTERINAEEALRESERDKSIILANMSECLVYMNDDLEVVWANKAAGDWVGSAPGDLIGRKCHEIWFGEDEICKDCHVLTVFKNGKPVEREYTWPDGSIWNIRSDPVRDDSGRIIGAIELSSDVTERKAAEALAAVHRDLGKELSGETDMNRTLAKCVDAAINASGMDSGGVYLIKPGTGEMDLVYSVGLGPGFVESVSHYGPESPNTKMAIAGKPVYALYSAVGIPLNEADEREGLRAVAVIPIKHENDVLGCLNVGSHSLKNIPESIREALEAIAAQAAVVISRIKAEEALAESEEKYKTAVESMDEGAGFVDPGEVLTFVNRAFAENLGYTVEELTGKSLKYITTGKGYKKILKETEKRRAGGRSKYVIEMKHRDGRRLDFLVSAMPLFADDGTYAGAAATVSRLPEIGRNVR